MEVEQDPLVLSLDEPVVEQHRPEQVQREAVLLLALPPGSLPIPMSEMLWWREVPGWASPEVLALLVGPLVEWQPEMVPL